MNKITLHPYISVLLGSVFLGLFAQTFYFGKMIMDFIAQDPSGGVNPQLQYQIVNTVILGLIYLATSAYFFLAIAQNKPLVTIEDFKPSTEKKSKIKLDLPKDDLDEEKNSK